MPSEPSNVRVVHCPECRFWVRTFHFDVDRAGNRGLDENKIKAGVDLHRAHYVMSEAHYHMRNEKCNERCVA